MKEIVPPKISINEFRVETLSLGKKFLDVSFNFAIDIENLSTKSKLYRRLGLGDNIVNFILMVLEDLKKVAGTSTAKIKNKEDVKEKLVNTLNRLKLEIKDLEKIKDHEKYMKAFNRINCYKVDFSEIGA